MSNMNCKPCEKQTAELAVFSKLRQLQHHADLQAARHLQSQSWVARLGESLAESAQQLTTLGVVERQTAKLVIEKGTHSLGLLSHEHTALSTIVQQLKAAAGQRKEQRQNDLEPNLDGKCSNIGVLHVPWWRGDTLQTPRQVVSPQWGVSIGCAVGHPQPVSCAFRYDGLPVIMSSWHQQLPQDGRTPKKHTHCAVCTHI